MKAGSYKARRVHFADYAAAFFNPFLFSADWRARQGCGASALALLTGVLPERIARENGDPHYSDRFMLRFLRNRGFMATELTLCRISASTSSIGRNHVVLLSQLFRPCEATWGVIFNATTYFHNFEWYDVGALSLLNKPVMSAYLVVHPTWRARRTLTKAKHDVRSAKSAVRFAKLGIAK